MSHPCTIQAALDSENTQVTELTLLSADFVTRETSLESSVHDLTMLCETDEESDILNNDHMDYLQDKKLVFYVL